MNNVILIEDLIGKGITNIYVTYGLEQGWLDTAKCYIELDSHLIIDIPYCSDKSNNEVWVQKLDPNAKSIFVPDTVEHPIDKIIRRVFRQPKTEKPELIKNTKIVDFIWYDESIDKGFLLLSNGCLISETTMSPSGTGMAGINFYDSIEKLIKAHGKDYKKISEIKPSDN
jgi:hypothetical protein